MDDRVREYWRNFFQTGQVQDYLRYRQAAEQEQLNPRRRVINSSKHKHFY